MLNGIGQPCASSLDPHLCLPPFKTSLKSLFPHQYPANAPSPPPYTLARLRTFRCKQCCCGPFHSLPGFFQCAPICSICLIIWTIGAEPRSRRVPTITPPCQHFPEFGDISCQDAQELRGGSFRPGKGSPRAPLPQAGISWDALLSPTDERVLGRRKGRKGKGRTKSGIRSQTCFSRNEQLLGQVGVDKKGRISLLWQESAD